MRGASQRHFLPHSLREALAAGTSLRLEIEQLDEMLGPRRGVRFIHAPEAGDEFEVLDGIELVVDQWLVGHPGRDGFGRHRIFERVDTENADRAFVGSQQACNHAQSRGFSGTIRAEKRIELAAAYRKRKIVDRPMRKGLGQTTDFECWGSLIVVTHNFNDR